MNSSNRIWTYYTNETKPHFCKNDLVTNITKEYVFFNRSYVMNAFKKHTDRMEGMLDKDLKAVMYVGPLGGGATTNETLLFVSPMQSCGVFSVHKFREHHDWYELRFKDADGTGDPDPECVEKFRSITQEFSLVYNSTCKEIFPPRVADANNIILP
uniref:Putative lipocalin-3 1 n=1 Tax=Amblyomma triste TaxID=251400 RepID=A0A023G737_AMBTT